MGGAAWGSCSCGRWVGTRMAHEWADGNQSANPMCSAVRARTVARPTGRQRQPRLCAQGRALQARRGGGRRRQPSWCGVCFPDVLPSQHQTPILRMSHNTATTNCHQAGGRSAMCRGGRWRRRPRRWRACSWAASASAASTPSLGSWGKRRWRRCAGSGQRRGACWCT